MIYELVSQRSPKPITHPCQHVKQISHNLFKQERSKASWEHKLSYRHKGLLMGWTGLDWWSRQKAIHKRHQQILLGH